MKKHISNNNIFSLPPSILSHAYLTHAPTRGTHYLGLRSSSPTAGKRRRERKQHERPKSGQPAKPHTKKHQTRKNATEDKFPPSRELQTISGIAASSILKWYLDFITTILIRGTFDFGDDGSNLLLFVIDRRTLVIAPLKFN